MSEQQLVPERRYDGVTPPPRILWLALGLFLFIVIITLVGIIIYQREQRIAALVPLAAIGVAGLLVGCGISLWMYRKNLPRRFALWVIVALFLLMLVGSIGSVIVFRSILPPRYQEGIVTIVPFMRALMPATPVGGSLPTAIAPENGDISPQDLLSAPLILGGTPTATPSPEATEEVVQVEASATPTATSTPEITPTATLTPTDEATEEVVQSIPPTRPSEFEVAVSSPSRPGSARLFGFNYIKQGWNECGPANITMALSYYGWRDPITTAESFLKPNDEDKNVNPGEMVAFVNERTQVRAITRIGGDINLLKDFLAADLAVIIETGYMFEGYDWLGHYQTLVAYDDLGKVFYLYDSYLGPGENNEGLPESYDTFDEQWKHFNRTFIVIYPPEREVEVARILGDRADLVGAAEHALAVGQAEARANPQDPFAWFNIGTALTRLERYDEAAAAYDRSRQVGTIPWRITWYQHGPFEAYFNAGRYADVLALVQANLNNTPYVEETFYWQGKALAAQGDRSGADAAYRRALSLNPRYTAAQQALNQLNA